MYKKGMLMCQGLIPLCQVIFVLALCICCVVMWHNSRLTISSYSFCINWNFYLPILINLFFPRSAYCGGLWLAALRVMSEIAMILGCPGDSKKYNNILQRGKKAYERKLWNGTVSVWNIALLAIIVWRRAIVVWRTEMKPRHPDR